MSSFEIGKFPTEEACREDEEGGFFERLLNEKSQLCIAIYKGFTKAMFFLYLLVAFFFCILAWSSNVFLTGSPFLDGIIFLVGGLIIAVVHAVVNMLIIQFLNNVQIIRKKIEKM